MPRENDIPPAPSASPVLAVENHLRNLGCEGVSIGRTAGVWGVRSSEFPGGRLLVCEPCEAFALRVLPGESHAVAVLPLANTTPLIHQGSVIPEGGAGFSTPGGPQIVSARGATRFAVLWIHTPESTEKSPSVTAVLPSPPNGHHGQSLEAISENDADALARFASALAAKAAEAFAAGTAGTREKPPRRLVNRMALVNTLWNFMAKEMEDDLTLVQFEQLTGKSSRTLEYAFTEIVGRTPIGFLKALRMRKARQTLLEARFPSVKKAAAACGLWHFGRFSIDYRLQFGEPPSATLKKALAASE